MHSRKWAFFLIYLCIWVLSTLPDIIGAEWKFNSSPYRFPHWILTPLSEIRKIHVVPLLHDNTSYIYRELLSLLLNLLASIPNCPVLKTLSLWLSPGACNPDSLPSCHISIYWVTQNWTSSWCVAWGSCFSPPLSPHSLNTMGDRTVGLAACSPHCQTLHLVTFAFPSILLFLPFTNGFSTRPSHWVSHTPVWVQLS